MKDFAKSIVCNVKAEVAAIENAVVGNYDPNDYKDDPRHKWTVKSIENEIQKYKQRIELNRVRMTQLRNMENSGNYPSATRELKEEQKEYEANQMKVKQLVSMLRRATGNSMEEVGNAYQYAGSIPIEKIPDNWRPEFPKAGYVVYYAPNKAKWFATEAEAKRFAAQVGNSKVGNKITKFGAGTKVIAEGHKAVVVKEEEHSGPNGIPFGWVTVKWEDGPWKGQTDEYYDYDLRRA